MCFDLDSRPPIAPIAGGALDGSQQTLTADDGTAFTAFLARAADPTGAGVVILPDVRGLHPYYEELALRFAEHGIDAIAIDYFGRTAGFAEHGARDEGFDYAPHVNQTTFAGLSADTRAAARCLREQDGGRVRSLFTVGFCFGGRFAFDTAILGLDLAGVVGFYGNPVGPGRNDAPAPADVAGRFGSPVLGLFGGADQGIPAENIHAFDEALARAGIEHELITYEGAPHSFFDRKFEQYAEASAQAWDAVRAFIARHSTGK